MLTIPKETPVMEIFAALDTYMHEHWHATHRDATAMSDGRTFWTVITAMRGPDTEDSDMKQATLHLRAVVFPKMAHYVSFPDVPRTPSIQKALDIARAADDAHFHFANHIRLAVEDLGRAGVK